MKKILFIIVALFIMNSVNAQEHVKFMGMEVNGNITQFVDKLKTKGFTFKEHITEDYCYILSGTFAGIKNCEIYCLYTPQTKIVCKVAVFLPEETTWDALETQYNNFKELYDTKYTIYKKYQFFKSPYYLGDDDEMIALKNDYCTYITFYNDANGNFITLNINNTCQIRCVYEDNTNFELRTKEMQNIISNDI